MKKLILIFCTFQIFFILRTTRAFEEIEIQDKKSQQLPSLKKQFEEIEEQPLNLENRLRENYEIYNGKIMRSEDVGFEELKKLVTIHYSKL